MVRRLNTRNAAREADKVIQKAGLLVTTEGEGAKTPMLLTDEFVAEFRADVTRARSRS